MLHSSFSKERILGFAILLGVSVITLFPVLYVIINSFKLPDGGWGLGGWNDALFGDVRTLSSIFYSFLLSIRAPIAVAVAFFLSWLIVRVQIPGARWIELGIWLAFFLPSLPVTLGWILLGDPNYGILNQLLKTIGLPNLINIYSITGILWVHLTVSTIPIMTILLAPAFRQLDASYEEAAKMCGASYIRTMQKITLPILGPAVLTALIAGLIRSLEAFEIEQLLGTPRGIQVYSNRIYDLIHMVPPQMNTVFSLSTMFLLFLLILAFIHQRLTLRQPHATVTGRSANFRPIEMNVKWKVIFSAICFFFLFIAMIVPFATLLVGSFMTLFGFFNLPDVWTVSHWTTVFLNPDFLQAAMNSVLLGIGSGGIAIIVYIILGYCMGSSNLPGKRGLAVLTWLPWTIPGVLLGVSTMAIMLYVPGFKLMYGTMFALIYVMVIKEMPIGAQMIKTSFQQLSKELTEAAYMSGASWLQTLRRISIPNIAPMLVSIFVIVFAATIRDISTTILLANPATRTLPLLMMELSTNGNMQEASVIGVTTGLIGFALGMLIKRYKFM